jgi:hypothetical protein
MDPILGFVVIVLAIWGARRGVPKAGSKINGARKNSIEKWKQSHPNSPAIARWGAGLGALGPTLRHGLPYLRDGLRDAYREAKQEAEAKYMNRNRPSVEPKPNTKSAKGEGVKCPHCDKPLKRSKGHAGRFEPCDCRTQPTNGGGTHNQNTNGGTSDQTETTQGRFMWRCRKCRAEKVGFTTQAAADADSKTHKCSEDKKDQTPNGDPKMADKKYIEVVDCFTLLAAMEEKHQDAVHELEDARADHKRASEDLAHMTRIEATLKNFGVPDDQLKEFTALIEADKARVAAADARFKGADAEVAAAKAAVEMAQRHVAMAGTAVGPFYQNAKGYQTARS